MLKRSFHLSTSVKSLNIPSRQARDPGRQDVVPGRVRQVRAVRPVRAPGRGRGEEVPPGHGGGRSGEGAEADRPGGLRGGHGRAGGKGVPSRSCSCCCCLLLLLLLLFLVSASNHLGLENTTFPFIMSLSIPSSSPTPGWSSAARSPSPWTHSKTRATPLQQQSPPPLLARGRSRQRCCSVTRRSKPRHWTSGEN